MPAASHIADARAPKAELVDIVSTWHERVIDLAARIEVPVHYRQAEFDGLWIVDEDEVRSFGAALSKSPMVDAALAPGVGHCIDFHRRSAEFHAQQLNFAMQCAALPV
jgi:pimeloyl-ACP methyl ester carboxylesterase